MTTPETAPDEVTQADIDAAVAYWRGWSNNIPVADGEYHPLVQAFARHRLTPRQDGLREALVDHNERLRSAVAIADREGADTNWLAFRGQCRFTLAEHQDVVNEARAAIGVRNGYAPGNYSIFCIDCKREAHDCDKGAIRCAECAAALSDISPLANEETVDLEALANKPVGDDFSLRAFNVVRCLAKAEFRSEIDRCKDEAEYLMTRLRGERLPDYLRIPFPELSLANDTGAWREAVPADLRRLVVAAREIAFNDWDGDSEEWEVARKELDDASEAFASRVPWADEPKALSPDDGEGK